MEVYINEKDWNTILNYAKYAENSMGTEIGGMSVVLEDKDGDWKIQDPVIMKQEVGGGSCELDKAELAEYYSKMEIKYRNHNMRFCWWHSHASMSAFWSGTDTNTIDEYKDGDLSFALVINIRGEYKCRISVWKPLVFHKDVELRVASPSEVKVPKKISKEVDKLCTKPVYKSLQTNLLTTGTQTTIRNWNKSFQKEDPMEKLVEETWEALTEKVDELNGELLMGSKQYEEYVSMMEKLNNKLSKRHIPLKVKILSKNTMEDILHITPYQLIECTDPRYADCNPVCSYGEYYGAY